MAATAGLAVLIDGCEAENTPSSQKQRAILPSHLSSRGDVCHRGRLPAFDLPASIHSGQYSTTRIRVAVQRP
jgi:hypothetical protein